MTPPSDRAEALHAAANALGVRVPIEPCTQLLAYLDAMLEENRRVNLTAIRDPDDALILHALDSLAFGLAAHGVDPSRTLDLGTGNGFPGMAIACMHETADVTLLDKTRRKILAIERALEACNLGPDDRLRAVHADAQQVPGLGTLGSFSLVTARAVNEPLAIGKLVSPLLDTGSNLLLWLAADTEAPTRLGASFNRASEHRYTLPASDSPQDRPRESRERRLVRYTKR